MPMMCRSSYVCASDLRRYAVAGKQAVEALDIRAAHGTGPRMPQVQQHRGETPRRAGDTGAQQAQGESRILEGMAGIGVVEAVDPVDVGAPDREIAGDRKSTRLNFSH